MESIPSFQTIRRTDGIDPAARHHARSTPRMSVSLAERFPDSAVQVLPRLKHYLHVEAPGTVAELIEGFLSAARGA